MKAIISEKYGTPNTLQLGEAATPTPKQDQVLVRVHASSINYSNLVCLTGKPLPARIVLGLTKPKYRIPGGDMAGVVEATGEHVTQFQVGDEVYGDLSSSGWGTYAEYVVADENSIALKPSNLSFEEAAAVPMAAMTALQAIRDKGMVQPEQKVLIHGASGGVGTFAVQIAKALSAEVTAVVSTRNVEIAKSLGADRIIDYQKEDFASGDETYDVIIGVNGSRPISTYNRKLKEKGIFVHVGGPISQMYQNMLLRPWYSAIGKKRFITFLQRPNVQDLVQINELIQAGKVQPVIDRTYPLSETCQAFQYFEKGHSQGKVVISIQEA